MANALTLCIQWALSDAQSAIIKERDIEDKGRNRFREGESEGEGGGEGEGDEMKGREGEGEGDARGAPEKSTKLYTDGEADSKLGIRVFSFSCHV